MKSPDEIKKGLECCGTLDGDCESCPFDDGLQTFCNDRLRKDALAYIRQLERENANLVKAVRDTAELMVSGTELMSKRIKELECERDAAFEKLKAYKWYEGDAVD